MYRITQEALTNVMRHAAATRCLVVVSVGAGAGHDDVLTWRLRDDGRGIGDLDAALRRGTGLAGFKDRIWALDGTFACLSGPGRTGTELRAEFPIESPSA